MSDAIETQFARLDERLKSLERKTDDHHQSVMMEIGELKNNLAFRLNSVEEQMHMMERVKLTKDEQDRVNNRLDTRVTWLERISYIGLGLIMALEFYFRFFK